MPISFFLPCKLTTYKPPRVCKGVTYSPHSVEKKRLQWMIQGMGLKPASGPVVVHWQFIRPFPKSASKAQLRQMRSGLMVPVTRPDCSNYQKFFEDAFTGYLWHDDSQIVTYTGCKRYGEVEGVFIHVQEYIIY